MACDETLPPMRMLLRIAVLYLVAITSGLAAGSEKHVVLVVWDGMRPDFVNSANTPTLYALAHRGVFFAHNHSVYVSSTEVNGTALATGTYPQHSGVIGNREYRPDISPLSPIATESLEVMRKADQQGRYLAVPTVAETLQHQGYHTIVAGTKPVALLHDRAERPDDVESVVLFEGQSLPASRSPGIIKVLGPFSDEGDSKTNRDIWTARALTELLWKKEVPSFSLLWLAEPDNTQHTMGVGSAPALAAIHNSDDALSRVVAALKGKGVYDQTDIMVVSDHGFSTISTNVNVLAHLRHAGFKAVRQFDGPPAKGDVLVVGLGGSVLLYVIGHEEKTIDRLVSFLQTEDSVGTIFTARARAGTFALDEVRIHSAQAPDVVFSMRWTTGTNANGFPGFIASETQGSNLSVTGQKATHASLSPFDLHNTLIAAGPDFRQGMIDEIPSGNVDVAPTILKILGVKPTQPMDGRVLSEALNTSNARSPKIEQRELRAHASLPVGEWTQSLDISEVEGVRYLVKGTGEFAPKSSVNR